MSKYTIAQQYKASDFIKKTGENVYVSKDGKYGIRGDKEGFWYPYEITNEGQRNHWYFMVNVSYDYSFSFEKCLIILNKILSGTWKQGQGCFLNGITSD